MTHHFESPPRRCWDLSSHDSQTTKKSWRELRWFLEVTIDSRQTDVALLMEISGLIHGVAVLLRIGVVC
jgi:hypothetical protein